MAVIKMSATQARKNFFDLLNAAKYGQQTTIVLKNNKEVARIMPPAIKQPNWSLYLSKVKRMKPFLTEQDMQSIKQVRKDFKVREAW